MRRVIVLTGVIAGAVIGSKLLLEDVLGLSIASAAGEWLAHAGAGSAILIVALLAVDVFFPVPSSVVMVLSGAAFGVIPGAALALAGSIAGGLLGFELVRRYGRRVSTRLVGDNEVQDLHRFFERHGVAAVIVTRPLPIVMETMSIVAGLSGMSRRAFLGASLLGTGPIVVVYAYAGAVSRDAGSVIPAAVVIVVASGVAWLYYRTRASAWKSFRA